MQPSKFVVKCGNFAVLVDLHILPQGSQDNSNWFSQEHKEEVGALIRDAVEQRVRRFPEARQALSKHRKELSPDNPLCLKGRTLRLAAYCMKRHINLRCIIKKHCQELRVFPERFVVCVSLLDCTMTHDGSLNLDMMKQRGQNKSEYFSGPGEILNLLNSSTITKKDALQKIARGKQTNAQPQSEPEHNLQTLDQDQDQAARLNQPPSSDVADGDVLSPSGPLAPTQYGTMEVSMQEAHKGVEVSATVPVISIVTGSGNHVEKDNQIWKSQKCQEQHDRDQSSQYNTWDIETTDRGKRRILSSPREDFNQELKRVCLRKPSNRTATYSSSAIATSLNSTMGLSPSHPAAAQVERVLEEELLTHGKQALSLPLSNGTAKQANQSRLATSLRGLSVKAVSSGSSISSRLAAKAEERVSAPRISRLRRLKKS